MKLIVHAVAIGVVLLLALPRQLRGAPPKWAHCEYELGVLEDREYDALILRIADYEQHCETKFVVPTKQPKDSDASDTKIIQNTATEQSINCQKEVSELTTEYAKIGPKYFDLLARICEFEITPDCVDEQQELMNQYTDYILRKIAFWRNCHGDESDDHSCVTELVELTMQYTEYHDTHSYIGTICMMPGPQKPAKEEPSGLKKKVINQMLVSLATGHQDGYQDEIESSESDEAIQKLLNIMLLLQ